jgi:hypothetical protein
MSARVDEMTADLAVEQARAIEHVAMPKGDQQSRTRSRCVILVVVWLASALTTRWAKPLSKHRAAA